jgi:hypothetical protein
VQFPHLARFRFRRSLAGRYLAPVDRRTAKRGRLTSIGRSALRSDRPKRRTVTVRASVGSTEVSRKPVRGSMPSAPWSPSTRERLRLRQRCRQPRPQRERPAAGIGEERLELRLAAEPPGVVETAGDRLTGRRHGAGREPPPPRRGSSGSSLSLVATAAGTQPNPAGIAPRTRPVQIRESLCNRRAPLADHLAWSAPGDAPGLIRLSLPCAENVLARCPSTPRARPP